VCLQATTREKNHDDLSTIQVIVVTLDSSRKKTTKMMSTMLVIVVSKLATQKGNQDNELRSLS
jgi:hypothetical protein